MASDDEDVPESGAVFTFGKTRFAENLASKFWIRDDPVVFVSCGDEHSAIITAKGKLYTFGSNDWGQLGHGNTKPYSKPSVVKKLKPEKSYLVACGRNHTLVATESGILYSFGCGGDGQLGHGDSEGSQEPKAIESLREQKYSRLACGSDFSAAVTDKGALFTWGSSGEGQNGQGEDSESPVQLHLAGKVVSVACGYYHMAVVTDDGLLYTCGESEGGKLGLERLQLDDTSELQVVQSIKEKVSSVSCGSEFTVAVTQNGHVYGFGQGNQGQLGLGSLQMECELPEKVQTFNKIRAKSVECGESFTAVVTKHGNLYTFGDGRHGKLGLGDECFSNLFKPEKVTRFKNFIVKKVSCGGCHMLVSAVKKEETLDNSDSEEQVEDDILMATMKGPLLDTVDGPRDLSATWSARDKRRQKNVEDISNSLSRSLPPINKSSLPPLNGSLKHTLPSLTSTSLSTTEDKKPLNMIAMPQISYPDHNGNKLSSKSSPKPLPRGLARPSPLAAPRSLPKARKEKEESESEEDSGSEEEEEENEKNRKEGKENMKKVEETMKAKLTDEESEEESEDEEESEEDEEEEDTKKIVNKDQKVKVVTIPKKDEEDSGEGSQEDDEEEDAEDDGGGNKNKFIEASKDEIKEVSKSKPKKIEVEKKSKKKSKEKSEQEDEEEEKESGEEADAKKKTKDNKEDEKDKKNKKKNKHDDKETEEDKTEESTEENKTKKAKKGKKKKEDKNGDQENEDKQDAKEDDKTDESNKDDETKDSETKEKENTAKTSEKQKDKKSGICVVL